MHLVALLGTNTPSRSRDSILFPNLNRVCAADFVGLHLHALYIAAFWLGAAHMPILFFFVNGA